MAEGNIGFGDAIRTIAKTKELEEKANRALQAALAAEKSAIAAQRAIWWISAGGGSGAVSGVDTGKVPGVDTLTQAAIDAAKKALQNDPNKQGNDPTKDATKPEKGGTDLSGAGTPSEAAVPAAKDLLDAASQNDGDHNRITSQIIESTDDVIPNYYNGVIVKSPDGDDVLLAFRDFWRGIVPGWADENTPPVYEGFQQGYFWRATNPALGEGAVPSFAATAAVDHVKELFPDPYPAGYGDALITTEAYEVDVDTWQFGWKQSPLSPSENIVNIDRVSCTTEGPIICPSSAPTKEDVWPVIGNGILAFINGHWTSNQYDSEIPPIYQTPISSVSFSMGDDRWGRMEPAKNGGKLLYEVDGENSLNPKTGSFGILFRPNNTIEKFVDNGALHFYTLNL